LRAAIAAVAADPIALAIVADAAAAPSPRPGAVMRGWSNLLWRSWA